MPFVYAAAFEKGLFPGSVVEDSALDNRAVMIGGTTGILGEWGPETRRQPLRRADHRARSAREIEERRNRSHRHARRARAGHCSLCKSGRDQFNTSAVSGDFSRQQRDHSGGTGPGLHDLSQWRLAADAPHILDRIEEKDGTVVWRSERDRAQQTVMKPETAYEVHLVPDGCADQWHRASRATKNMG